MISNHRHGDFQPHNSNHRDFHSISITYISGNYEGPVGICWVMLGSPRFWWLYFHFSTDVSGGSQKGIGELLKRVNRRRGSISDAPDFFLAEWTNSDLRGKKNIDPGAS